MITEADYTAWSYEEIVPYLDTVAEYFGVDRLCFGSDWPVCSSGGQLRQNDRSNYEVVEAIQ